MENLHRLSISNSGVVALDSVPVKGITGFCLDCHKEDGGRTHSYPASRYSSSCGRGAEASDSRRSLHKPKRDRYICKSGEAGKYLVERISDGRRTLVSEVIHYSDGTVDWEWGPRVPFDCISEAEDVHP